MVPGHAETWIRQMEPFYVLFSCQSLSTSTSVVQENAVVLSV